MRLVFEPFFQAFGCWIEQSMQEAPVPMLVVLLTVLTVLVAAALIYAARINARRQAVEQDLGIEKDISRAVLDSTGAIVVLLEPNGRLVRCSPGGERVFGMGSELVRGQFLWDLIGSPEEAAQIKRYLPELVASRRSVRRQSLLHTAKSGPRWFEWSNSFVFGEDGAVKWVLGAGMDITERKQYERRQEALVVLSSELRGFLSRQQTMEIILEQIRRFLLADVAAVAIYHPASSHLLVEKASGEGAHDLLGWIIPVDDSMVQAAIKNRQLVLRSGGLAGLSFTYPALLDSMCSTAWIPMVMEGDPVGFLIAGSRSALSEADLDEINAVANIAASAIHRCNLMDETQRRLHRLSSLYTINISVSASLDIHVTINLLVNQITTQLGVDAADIFLVDPVTRDLSFVAGYGFRTKDLHKTRVWLGQGRVGQVALERKSMQIYDPRGIASHFIPIRSLHGDSFIAYEAVPLVSKGEVKGVLETFHRAPYEPDPEWPQFLESLAAETTIAISNAEMMDKLQRSNMDMALAYDATLEGWAMALELRDHQTEDHTRRVTDMTVRLAQMLGIRGDELKYIRYGALLHDIGKIGIPDSILNKPGPLTDEEWEIMRKHPEYSQQMLSSIPFLSQAMIIPYCHHERWDGSGYPRKLAGEQIPLAARLFAVVDVWDAMCYNRVYREAYPEDEVLAFLRREAGRSFDPKVVAAFVEMRELQRGSL